jgi:hypothetical protein
MHIRRQRPTQKLPNRQLCPAYLVRITEDDKNRLLVGVGIIKFLLITNVQEAYHFCGLTWEHIDLKLRARLFKARD